MQLAACPKVRSLLAFPRGTPPFAACKAQMWLLRAPGQRDDRTLGLSPADAAAAAPRYFSTRGLDGHLRQRGTSIPGANTPVTAAAHAATRRIAPLVAFLPLRRVILLRQQPHTHRQAIAATWQMLLATCPKLLPSAPFPCATSPMVACKAHTRLLRAPRRWSHRTLG